MLLGFILFEKIEALTYQTVGLYNVNTLIQRPIFLCLVILIGLAICYGIRYINNNVKKVYKLVDGEHQKTDLITGLNSGGYTEIINGEIEEGDEVISKVIIETSNKKALRLF